MGINRSQINDPRSWAKWYASGAVGDIAKSRENRRKSFLNKMFHDRPMGIYGDDYQNRDNRPALKHYERLRRNGELPERTNHADAFGLGHGPQALQFAEHFHLSLCGDKPRDNLDLIIPEGLRQGHLCEHTLDHDLKLTKEWLQKWYTVLDDPRRSFTYQEEEGTLGQHMAKVFNNKTDFQDPPTAYQLSDGRDEELYEANFYLEKNLEYLDKLLRIKDLHNAIVREIEAKGLESRHVKCILGLLSREPRDLDAFLKHIKEEDVKKTTEAIDEVLGYAILALKSMFKETQPHVKEFIIKLLEQGNFNGPQYETVIPTIKKYMEDAEERSELLKYIGLAA